MKKLLFRRTQGKAVTYFREFKQGDVLKAAYMVIFNDTPSARNAVTKVCESFMGQRFDVPALAELPKMIVETEKNIRDSADMLRISKRQLKDYLYTINYNKDRQRVDEMIKQNQKEVCTLEIFKFMVAKEKAIYNALNMMQARNQSYIGFIWAPYELQGEISSALSQFHTTNFNMYRDDPDQPHALNPPTYFKQNEVTSMFQIIVDTYGIPNYMEANPAPFTVVTFPFMFGIMFGDYGHGSLIFLTGFILTMFADHLKTSLPEGVMQARYMLLAMGTFSMYNGLLYNEFFAIPNDWFGSCYNTTVRNTTDLNGSNNLVYPPNLSPPGTFYWGNANPDEPESEGSNTYEGSDCVYMFGVDPAWYLSPQMLTYTNSIKMRMAVIIGVWHMSMAICVKGFNAVREKQWLVFVFEVVGGLIILNGLFGWMDALIIMKWTYPMNAYSTDESPCTDDSNLIDDVSYMGCGPVLTLRYCPAIITVMINNFLKMGAQDVYFFDGQKGVTLFLVILVVICMPLMLCVKPCVWGCCTKKDHHSEEEIERIQAQQDSLEDLNPNANGQSIEENVKDDMKAYEALLQLEAGGAEAHGHTFGELFIH
jgi:V-type H+-transporting ATPase subunit a